MSKNFMKVKIIELNKPTLSGRIYPTKVIEDCIINNNIIKQQLDNNLLFIEYIDNDTISNYEINLEKTIGVISNLYIEDSKLYCDFKLLDDFPYAKYIKDVKLYLWGLGNIDENNIVTDCRFCKFLCKGEIEDA